MSGAAVPRVVVVTKAGCHLCDDAMTVVAAVCDSLDVAWTPRQLIDVPEPQRSHWTELVPVVLVDEAVHDVFRVDAERLRDALS
jgi:Glutaredoxin-like domain (DUF836)